MRSRLPVVLVLPAVLGLAFLLVPLAGLLIKAPWTTLPAQLFRDEGMIHDPVPRSLFQPVCNLGKILSVTSNIKTAFTLNNLSHILHSSLFNMALFYYSE